MNPASRAGGSPEHGDCRHQGNQGGQNLSGGSEPPGSAGTEGGKHIHSLHSAPAEDSAEQERKQNETSCRLLKPAAYAGAF